MVVQKQEEVLISAQGEFIQILYEYPEILEEGQSIVPLSNYYDVLNLERYPIAVWSFDLLKWIGQGEQRPEVIPGPSIDEKIEEVAQANLMTLDLSATLYEQSLVQQEQTLTALDVAAALYEQLMLLQGGEPK